MARTRERPLRVPRERTRVDLLEASWLSVLRAI